MILFWEYHKPMRPFNSASVAFLSALVLILFVALPAISQVNGPPASVTSPGFGGNRVNGPRSSVTSVGPQGYNPPHHHPFKGTANGNNGSNGGDHHRQHNNSEAVGPVWYAVPVPYAVDNPPVEDQPAEAEEPSDEQGGPTVFDRRGSGASSYMPPTKSVVPAHPSEHATEHAEEPPPVDPDPPLAPTLFIFKDGRTLEVANYAILGQTIYDLTPGHRRKIALIDLDLEATRKQNDERGVMFQLPQGTHVN
jgi:hypothetical protein